MSDDPVIALLNGINDRLGRLEHGQTGLQQGQATLQQNQTVLRVDLMAQTGRLGDQITSIREDTTVNMGAADGERRHQGGAARTGRDGLYDAPPDAPFADAG